MINEGRKVEFKTSLGDKSEVGNVQNASSPYLAEWGSEVEDDNKRDDEIVFEDVQELNK